ncbi:hypothetical protein NQ117_01040 [Paenibacillus sp. SC116]|uniref:hypothetical protein n=1 Tax=Paenibacillus sp. SC116 TaxID=2968986 RepID=UPI00215A8B43|nr:hypothetical protein [Paenibacillus sp. SC116]MCR8842259.1 hypothetical protein [Paenibacillus sp. SC116]
MTNPAARRLHHILHNPYMSVLIGLCFLVAALIELEEINQLGVHHGLLLFGIWNVLKILPLVISGIRHLHKASTGESIWTRWLQSLHDITSHSFTECLIGIIYIVTAIMEAEHSVIYEWSQKEVDIHHGFMLYGFLLVAKTLPLIYSGVHHLVESNRNKLPKWFAKLENQYFELVAAVLFIGTGLYEIMEGFLTKNMDDVVSYAFLFLLVGLMRSLKYMLHIYEGLALIEKRVSKRDSEKFL